MEDSIKAIIAGKPVPVDHILNHHSEDHGNTIPVTKRNVCYICGTVIFDEQGRVLLVQEAKPSCYGQWYLPAGRLEPGETIVDGAKREVKEEAGLECELTTLLCVELNGIWMRFTFIGVVTGGSLKTLEEKDKESLQAKFFPLEELPNPIRPTKLRSEPNTSSSQGGCCVLRCNDILKLIDLGRKYNEEKGHRECLPVIYPHKYVSYRFIIIDRSNASSMHILAIRKGEKRCIPTYLVNVRGHVPEFTMVASIINAAFSMGPSQCSFQTCGVLGLEHRGTGEAEDGVCISQLISLGLAEEHALPEITSPKEFSWLEVTCSDLRSLLNEGCRKNIIPLL